MDASRPDGQRARPAPAALVATLAAATLTLGADAAAQSVVQPGGPGATPGEAALEGTVYLGELPMSDGTVVLHHLEGSTQGDLDSTRVAPDGTFRFLLPRAPDPVFGDVYFASVRHDGVLYFGPAITQVEQLDSAYAVTAYDTLLAPAAGMSVPLRSRSIFFEPDSAGTWRVTDIFQLFNEEDRTLVTRQGGLVWAHPLPASATDVVAGEGELSFAAAEFEQGRLVVRAALPPGDRLFVVRYRVPDVRLEIPNVGPTGAFDVLVREPAPPVTVEGLELRDRIELEAGSTYLRFTGADVVAPSLSIVAGEEPTTPKVEWVAFLLALVLGGAGLLVLRPRPVPAGGVTPDRPPLMQGGGAEADNGSDAAGRAALLHHIARLDEDFAAGPGGPEERKVYERRRAALLRRIRAL